MPSLEELDVQIAELEQQIAASQQGGGVAGPDYSAFFKSPGYEFRLAEGTRAIDRSAAARGMLMSGGTLRELQRYGQGLAADEFGNYANRLATLAGIGQSASFQSGQVGSAAAGQVGRSATSIGETIMAGGTAQGAGIVDSANALTRGFSGAASALQQWGGGPNWGAINQQAFNDVNNPAFASIF